MLAGAHPAGRRTASQPSSPSTRSAFVAQELRPDLVLEADVRHLGHDPLEREAHREVAGVDDLVGAARVGVVDDRLRVVLRRERARRVVQARPLEHELHREVLPRLAAVPGDEDELGEVVHHLVDELDLLRLELAGAGPGTPAQQNTGMPSSTHLA